MMAPCVHYLRFTIIPNNNSLSNRSNDCFRTINEGWDVKKTNRHKMKLQQLTKNGQMRNFFSSGVTGRKGNELVERKETCNGFTIFQSFGVEHNTESIRLFKHNLFFTSQSMYAFYFVKHTNQTCSVYCVVKSIFRFLHVG